MSKQIIGDWYWDEKDNLLFHKCSETSKGCTQQIDSEIQCIGCKEEAPQAIVDVCLLCNIKSCSVFKPIEGRWGIGNGYFISKPYLAHLCRGESFPYYCNATQCRKCKNKIPKYIIKYCEENNVEI